MINLPTPALDAWRRRGDAKRHDDLWRAATWESAALEAHQAGHLERRKTCREAAEMIVMGQVCRKCDRSLTAYEFATLWSRTCQECEAKQQAAAADQSAVKIRGTMRAV